ADACAEQQRFDDIVGDVDEGLPSLVPNSRQLDLQAALGDRVEGGEGLVHEQNLRLHNQRAGQLQPLLHSTGELEGEFRCVLNEAHHLQVYLQLKPVIVRLSGQPRPKQNIFLNVQPGEQGRRCILEYHRPVGAWAINRRAPACAPTDDFDLADRGLFEPGNKVEDGALAATARPEQAVEIAAANFQVYRVDGAVKVTRHSLKLLADLYQPQRRPIRSGNLPHSRELGRPHLMSRQKTAPVSPMAR